MKSMAIGVLLLVATMGGTSYFFRKHLWKVDLSDKEVAAAYVAAGMLVLVALLVSTRIFVKK